MTRVGVIGAVRARFVDEVNGWSDARRLGALVSLWLASLLTYYVFLLRPYGLAAHLSTPRASLPTLAHREPRAAVQFLLCFLLAFLFYALAYRVCRGWRSRLGVGVCLAMGLALAALLLFVYPIGATDVFDYAVQGEQLALAGLNPLVTPAAATPTLPLLRYAAYSRAISPYGPVWISLQAAVVKLTAGGGVFATVLGFKVLALLGYLFACAMIAALLRRRAPQLTAAGLAAFAWNPLVLYEVAVNAHNDIWIAALVLAGVLFWDRRHPFMMLAALTLALLVKAIVAPLLPLFALAAWRREKSRPGLHLALAGVLLVAALTALPYLSLPQGVKGMGALLQRTELFTHSLPAVASFVLDTLMPKARANALVGAATTALFGLYTLLQLRNAWRKPEQVVRFAFNLMLLLMLLCMPWFQPWYLLTVMALAAVYPRENAPFQAALSTACVVVAYVVYGFVWFWWPPFIGNTLWINVLALGTSYVIPWTYAILSGLRGWRATRLLVKPSRI